MSLLIAEYANWVVAPNGAVMAPMEPAIAVQTFTPTASTSTAPFNVATKFVAVMADSAAYRILFGTDPVVSASTGWRVAPTMQPQFFGVSGSATRIAAISTA